MSRSDSPDQLDLFTPKPPRKKPSKPAPVTNVVKLGRRRRSAQPSIGPASVTVLPAHRMRGEVVCAAKSMLELPPVQWPRQRQRCADVFEDLIAGVPAELRQRAIADFLRAVDAEVSHRLAIGQRSEGDAR